MRTQKMKGLVGLAVIAISGLVFWNNSCQDDSVYAPRAHKQEVKDEAKGAAAWLHAIRANQTTGEVDPRDVLAARASIEQKRRNYKTSALNLQWQEMGPMNIGGRTRTLFIDPDNPSTIFTGSVSGGLFRSTTAGSSWQLVNGDASNQAITGITKTVNGDYYVCTGEGLHYGAFGRGGGGMLGGGIFKSTDGGNTFSVLQATVPTANSRSAEYAAMSFIYADPSAPDRVYVATNRGMRRTDDGGQTWVNPVENSPGLSPSEWLNGITDFTVATDGSVWVKSSTQILYSPNGDDASFVSMAGSGLPQNNSRSRIAVAPSNPDYVYVVHIDGSDQLSSVYRTTDRGQTWTLMIQGSNSFNPFNDQGSYDLLMAVDPSDPERFLMGGVDLWSWSASEGWQARGSRFDSPNNPFYVHADNHDAVWHPTNPNIVYVVNDGGIFRSANNGFTWTPVNTNYNTLQLYSITASADGQFLGGSQDNGTIAVLPELNNGNYGVRTPGITYEVATDVFANLDGDGGYVAASKLVPKVLFKEMQYGIMGRSENGGESFESFYDFPRMDPQFISGSLSSSFAEFIAPFELWESAEDVNSADSVQWKAERAIKPLGFALLSDTASEGTIEVPQPAAEFITSSFRVVHGPQELTSDANGVLSGDGSGWFDPATGAFKARFNQYYSLEVNAYCDLTYDAGDEVIIQSSVFNKPFTYTVPMNMSTGDSVMVQDPIQGAFFMGLRGRTAFGGNNYGGVWMTREVFDFATPRVNWWHILDVGNGNSVTVMTVSDDGDILWVGTTSGQLYRISNLNQARSRESADVDNGNTDRVTSIDLVTSYSGRRITGISIDPNDNDRVLVTLGNYGNNTYLYYSSNATSVSPIFASKQGDLPKMPLYDGVFNFFNGSEVILGTEYGVWSTSNIDQAAPSWTAEDDGFANVPVFMVKQGYDKRSSWEGDTLYSGYIDLATHGRGFVRSTSLMQMNALGGADNGDLTQIESIEDVLKFWPNPSAGMVSVQVECTARATASVVVRDLNGRSVLEQSFDVQQGTNVLMLNTEIFAPGVYLIEAAAPGFKKNGRLIKN